MLLVSTLNSATISRAKTLIPIQQLFRQARLIYANFEGKKLVGFNII